MGLFDMFKSDSGDKMTPHLAFATALIYCMGADGEMDNEEVGHLLSVLGGASEGGTIGVGANNRALLDAAVKYVRRNPPEKFLEEAAPLLTDAQRMCILVNMIDSALSDGQPEPEEQVLIAKFQKAFGINDERFQPFFEVIVMKHDRSVFTNANHPNNQPGFQVSLTGLR
ncbi:MAG: TerB family tellurite resistance protein [Magnetococcales bacterium]|nr:TerB family tellurite resistance protein [Magnetococcales bacterium]